MHQHNLSLSSTSASLLSPWFITSGVERFTPSQWLALLDKHQLSMAELATSTQSALDALGFSQKQQVQIQRAKKGELRLQDWLSKDNRHFYLSYSDDRYPDMLRTLVNPPLFLLGIGNPNLLTRTGVAVVGSRSPTHSGGEIAESLSAGISDQGLTIVSGLARGIDGRAHKGGLQGVGRTTAVVATGVDICYPKRHQALRQRIIDEGGCVISEFWLGMPPRKHQFPQRNRIIAALSSVTLVVEANIRSGSLITANLAADMGRDVMAVPGSIRNPLAEGCHHLIQQGAKLVTTVNDVVEEIQPVVSSQNKNRQHCDKKSEEQSLATDTLLDSVDFDVTHVDVIAERNKLPVSAVMAVLLEYELRGLVAAVPGGYVKLRGK